MSLLSLFDPFGTVPGSSLNWSQHALLKKAAGRPAAAPAGPAIDTARICQALDRVGQNVTQVVDAIDWLISDLDLRLDQQTELLGEQVELLTEIARTLRSPARTRAAERIRDAAELLRHHRNERALTAAEQAIGDDPNNDVAFTLAAWASLGIGDLLRARGYFREAAQATASAQGAQNRHMNAVHLAARLTFILDRPGAALRELDMAEPFIDAAVRSGHPDFTREQLCLACVSANKAGAIKFDRTVYYVGGNQPRAALETFQDVIEEHDALFCLMALTDPVLATSTEITEAAQEALRVHRELVDEIREMLPRAEARWQALRAEIQGHEISNADTAKAASRFDGLLSPDSGQRRAAEAKLKRFPRNRWLEDLAAIPSDLDRLEAKVRPLIERERMREAALEAGIEDLLRRRRKFLLVDRRRVDAVVGRLAILGGYNFELIAVEQDGKVQVAKQEVTEDLMEKYDEQVGSI